MENQRDRQIGAPGGWRLLAVVGVAALAVATACGGKNKGDTTDGLMADDASGAVPKVDPTLCDTKGKKVTTFDTNGDDRPDVWKLFKTVEEGETSVEVLSCKQVDFDHDNRKDYVIAYTRKGGKAFEKFDFDFDGRFDAFAQYNEKTGVLVEVQRDSGFDGRFDLKESYDSKGVLTSIKRDRNADGKPDVWEQFEKGELVAILYDDDFDNKVDRRDEIKKPKPAPKPDADPSATPPADGDTSGDTAATPTE